MAKIIFSTISGIPNSTKLPCFYEGMVNALVSHGNDVMLMITNQFMEKLWTSNASKADIDKKKLDEAIMAFNPDLVITCNNSLYENLPKLVTCPIVVYGTDSPALFIDLPGLKRNSERYNFLMASEDFITMAKEYFGKKMRSLEMLYFATDFVAEKIEQDKNISFIGTDFHFSGVPFQDFIISKDFTPQVKKDLKLFLESYKKDVLLDPKSHLKKLGLDSQLLKKISHTDLLNLISSNFRMQTLQAVSDLGLSLYGSKTWRNHCDYSIDMALAFVDEEISSAKENQDVYNSSKISINISHSQAGKAFSWRVRDIMACNSVLVSDPREDLVTQFGKYVKIPTYENAFEARKICQKLLADQKWREEIIEGSQLAIEEAHRFKHRIKDIEQITGVALTSASSGILTSLDANDFIWSPNTESGPVMVKIVAEKIWGKNGVIRSWRRQRRRERKQLKKIML
ncbi:MAG: glycosyltransferase [Pseudomonadota bacterium]